MNIISGDEFRKHVDTNRELFYSAVHEAGHVFAARNFNFRVAWVSIDPEFIWRDPLAIKNINRSDDVLAVAMTIASERMAPIANRGFVRERGERRILIEYCIETISGPFAEKLVNPDWSKTAANDIDQAQHYLAEFGRDTKARFDRQWNEIKTEAECFVEANESAIVQFAHFLMIERTIKEGEIDLFIEKARASARDADCVNEHDLIERDKDIIK
jgi:hypothetical protein